MYYLGVNILVGLYNFTLILCLRKFFEGLPSHGRVEAQSLRHASTSSCGSHSESSSAVSEQDWLSRVFGLLWQS